MNWQSYTMVRLTIPFILGMVMANFCLPLFPLSMSVLLTILCALLAILLVTQPQGSPLSATKGFGCAVMLFAFFSGMTLFVRSYRNVSWNVGYEDTPCFSGIIIDNPHKKARTWSVKVRTGNGKIILAHIARDSAEMSCIFSAGDSICFKAKYLQDTSPLHLPVLSGNLTDSMKNVSEQYRKYLFYNGISATCYIPKNSCSITPIPLSEKSVATRIRMLQGKTVAAYAHAGIEDDAAAVIGTMTSGHKAGLSKELKEKYSRSGVSHVLALSGFHLTVIYTFLEIILLGRIFRNRFNIVVRAIIMAVLWLFTIMAGLPPSLVRAALMCSFMILSALFGRPALTLNSCALAAMAMLSLRPLILFDVGFQLSFIAMTSICVCGKRLCMLCPSRRILFRYIWDIIAINLACTLFTAPIVGLYFQYLPIFSLFSNLTISILASLALYVAALWWILCWWEGVREWLTGILQWTAQMMNAIADWVSSSGYAVIHWCPSVFEVLALYGVMTFLLLFVKDKSSRNLIYMLCAMVLFCVIMILRKTGCMPDTWRI
ncbi:MAG: ComEC/Rec2 family competence protein [Bacteroides sp.]|nr:ComEC/Rec2 family competence protein [Roseburia sp.]MCM1346432.1 ComEC/Rec2 family competence protein [Bacteroides sp.]MCM1421905.1 ComEC/Rec2 family competence protein [Bacteroides sp.]